MMLMKNKQHNGGAFDTEERKREIREAITSADATGLIAGEERITEAETLLPIAPERR
jgi:hypothetical protein